MIWFQKQKRKLKWKRNRKKTKGEKASAIQNVALAFLLQNEANEISVWIFFKGFRDLTKLQKGRVFIKVMGIIAVWFWEALPSLLKCKIDKRGCIEELKEIKQWYGGRDLAIKITYLGLSSFSSYSLWLKGKWGGAIQPITMMSLVKSLKLEACVWNGK